MKNGKKRKRKRKILNRRIQINQNSNTLVNDLSWILQLSWCVTRVVLLSELNVILGHYMNKKWCLSFLQFFDQPVCTVYPAKNDKLFKCYWYLVGVLYQSIFFSGYFFLQFDGPWLIVLRSTFDVDSSIWVFMLDLQRDGPSPLKEGNLVLPEGSVVVNYINSCNCLNQLVNWLKTSL